MSSTVDTPTAAEDLPSDNATRLAIYDVMHDGDTVNGASLTFTEDQLYELVIPRLRMLVPRELHIAGEREYLAEKIEAFTGSLLHVQRDDGRVTLRLTGEPPRIKRPDETIGDYTHGLEPARERLDRDNAALRAKAFDVHEFVPSIKDDPDGPAFRALLASMKEHGYLRQFWLAETPDGTIVDGRARQHAADILKLEPPIVSYPKGAKKQAALRRDSPLNRVAIAIDSNHARLDQATIDLVHNEVSAVTGRPWDETARDLEITREWRKILPKDYVPMLEVKALPFGNEGREVQVTDDGRVMLRSLIVAAGFAPHRYDELKKYVPFEEARPASGRGTKKSFFARAQDIVSGIDAHQADEREKKRPRIEPQWTTIQEWLRKNVIS